jgi:hypothetical protein
MYSICSISSNPQDPQDGFQKLPGHHFQTVQLRSPRTHEKNFGITAPLAIQIAH